MFSSYVAPVLVLLISGVSLAAPAPATPTIPKELLEERASSVGMVYQQKMMMLKIGKAVPASDYCEWSTRWLEARLPLCGGKEERVEAYREHVARIAELERIFKPRVDAGQSSPVEISTVRYYKADAAVRLHQAGGTP